MYIYGSNDAFTGSETSTSATKIGTITFTTAAEEAYADLTGDYKHILITGSGAIYMDEIQVTWVAGETPDDGGTTDPVEPVVPVNLGAKTIAEFLALKNTTDTCVLTGVVANIDNTEYGNFDLVDATGTVYVFGLLTAAGESKQFASMDIAAGDTLTVKAIYNEYNSKSQAKNAIYVSHSKLVLTVAVTSENGTVDGLEDGGKYVRGAEATLTATPASGYKFVNWTSGETVVSTENPYKFTVTADVDLVANFVKDQGTALDNLNTTVAPVKMIENGQMIVIKNGVKYNVLGAKL